MSGGYQMMPKKAYASYRLVGYMVSYGKPEPYTFTSYAAVGYILQARPLQIPTALCWLRRSILEKWIS